MKTPSEVLDEIDSLIGSATPLPWNPKFVQDSIRHLADHLDCLAHYLARNVDSTSYSEGDLGSFGARWNRYHDGPAIAAVMNNSEALVEIARAVSEWKRLRETDCIDNDAAVIAQEDAMLAALAKLGGVP